MIDPLPYMTIPWLAAVLLAVIGWIIGKLGLGSGKLLLMMSAMLFCCSAVIVWSLDSLSLSYHSSQSWSSWELLWGWVGPILGFTQALVLTIASIALTSKQISDPSSGGKEPGSE